VVIQSWEHQGMATKFRGWPDAALDFFRGIEADNTKTYWTEHRPTYEADVKAPFEALSELVAEEFGPLKLTRPYRDIRFSKDKSPYKTHQGGHTGEGFYIQVDADGLMVAGGMYAPTPDQLRLYREVAGSDAHGGELQTIVDDLRSAGMEIAGDRLKTRPRGTAPDHPRLELLRHRSLYARTGWPADPWMADPDEVIARVRASWRRLRPLVEWFRTHLGPADSAG